MSSKYYEEVKIGGKTYVQRSEFSNFKILEDNGELKSFVDFITYEGEVGKLINEALIVKYNINEYFTTKENLHGDIILTSFTNADNLRNIVIPETIDGKKVVYMLDIFKDVDVDRIFLPDTMTTLPVSCFEGNEYIKEVYLSKSLKEVPAQCFKGCNKLKDINLSHIDTIGTEAFMLCSSLEKLLLENTKKICRGAFYKCIQLKSVITKDLFALSSDVFAFCINLKDVILSDNIETINSSAFRNCLKLSKINTPIKLKTIRNSAFESCHDLHSFDFRNIEVIKYNAFKYSGLNGNIHFPDSIKTIEVEAFYHCDFNQISISKNTDYATNAFGIHNIDKIKIRKGKEIEEEKEEER